MEKDKGERRNKGKGGLGKKINSSVFIKLSRTNLFIWKERYTFDLDEKTGNVGVGCG